MAKTIKGSLWKLLKIPPKVIYALGLGPIYGRLVLLLTTTGRKSGLPRITPLQYEEIDGKIYIGSARGTKADWYRNILADPNVHIRVGSRRFDGLGEAVSDQIRVADYLEYRFKKHPRMIGFIMSREGVSQNPTRLELEKLAERKAMVVITPKADLEMDRNP